MRGNGETPIEDGFFAANAYGGGFVGSHAKPPSLHELAQHQLSGENWEGLSKPERTIGLLVLGFLLVACTPVVVNTPIVFDSGTKLPPGADFSFSTVPAFSPTPEARLTVTPSITPAMTPSHTPTLSPSLSPIPSETVIASPTLSPTVEVSPSPTNTPEDYGYWCDLKDGYGGLMELDNQLGGTHLIETIKLNNISKDESDLCRYIAPEITDFNNALSSQLRLDGITDEEQKKAIFDQCKDLSLSIFDNPPPEIPGVTFERERTKAGWKDSISFETKTDQLWLMYDIHKDQCVFKVLP